MTAHWAGAKKPRRGNSLDVDEWLKNTVRRCDQMPMIDILQSIAINLGRIPVFEPPGYNNLIKEFSQEYAIYKNMSMATKLWILVTGSHSAQRKFLARRTPFDCGSFIANMQSAYVVALLISPKHRWMESVMK
uniref:Ubiquitin-like protease family profile domain-containing protein n=1 Tax=Ditylenchus dipsaci TaxID=166011 RepID=A0A915CWZ3_9BILA